MNQFPRLHFRFVAVPSLLAALAFSTYASADVLPPNDCTTAAGTTCSTAGPHSDQPGICTSETCHSGSPGGGSFPCVLCELVDAGPDAHDAGAPDAAPPDAAGSDSGLADAAINDAAHNTDSDSGNETPPPSTSLASSSGSCSASSALTGANDRGALFVGLGALGVIAATFSRRRRKE